MCHWFSWTKINNDNKQKFVFCSKHLVNRCNTALTEPWINLPDFAGDPIRMKQNWQLRSQKQLYQVIQDTQMSFLLLSSGMQITLSTEAREKKLAHRDLLMGLRWNWIRCRPAFLDTIRYLEITETAAGPVFLRAQGPANGVGSGTVVSWVSTPVSRLLRGTRGGSGWGAQVVVCGSARLEKGLAAQESFALGPKFIFIIHLTGVQWKFGNSIWIMSNIHHLSLFNKSKTEIIESSVYQGLKFNGADAQPKESWRQEESTSSCNLIQSKNSRTRNHQLSGAETGRKWRRNPDKSLRGSRSEAVFMYLNWQGQREFSVPAVCLPCCLFSCPTILLFLAFPSMFSFLIIVLCYLVNPFPFHHHQNSHANNIILQKYL